MLNKKRKERGYLIFLARIEDDKVVKEIIDIQRQLRGFPYLEISPPKKLHLSIKDCGYLTPEVKEKDEIPQTFLPQLVSQARSILERTNQFKVKLGKMGIFPGVVFIRVKDRGRIKQIQKQLASKVLGLSLSKREKEGFLPHISLASLKIRRLPEDLKQRLENLNKKFQFPREFTIDTIELVKIDEQAKPVFKTIEKVRLSLKS